MSASFASALAAARDAAAAQHYPQGALYVVATPIGNLADISLRALHVLQLVDAVACEDTRHTQALLRAYGIDKAGAGCACTSTTRREARAGRSSQRLQQGQRVAYASDAGTPAVSDPGARLVAAVRAAGLPRRAAARARAASRPCSAWPASRRGQRRFVFAGFLPAKAGEREAGGRGAGARSRAPVVLLEAPHRIEALAEALAAAGRAAASRSAAS